jgi:phospholipase/carboxylesterase
MTDKSTSLPHSTTKTARWGASPKTATHAVILLHGRSGTPQNIGNRFVSSLLLPSTESKLCVLAPAAEDRTWYPNRYSADFSQNEPWLSAAVERVEREVQELEAAGITRDKIIIGGFSQGACLAAKYVMRYPAKYWGVFVLAGAMPGLFSYVVNSLKGLEEFEGVDLKGTRVLVATGDEDPLVKPRAVEWTAWVFSKVNADVTKQVYDKVGHQICQESLNTIKEWVKEMNAST